jgi:hypothetical protein
MTTSKPGRARGRVAIVEIAATESTPATLAVEVAFDGETLTIGDKSHPITDELRRLAVALLDEVRQSYDRNH